MSRTNTLREHPRALLAGVRAGAPFLLVVFPFGMLFGAVATEAGMNPIETMSLTSLVIAGAAQFAFIQLISDGAPAAIAVLTALAVNMRMAMYSASLTPHIGRASLGTRALAAYFLVDQVYASAMRRYALTPDAPLGEKVAYYFGVVLPVCPLWYVATWIGVTTGEAIPPEYALDFAVPVTFAAVAAPMLRGAPNLAAAAVAIGASLAFAWIPYSLGLIVASGLGMATGYAVETALERRAARAAAPGDASLEGGRA